MRNIGSGSLLLLLLVARSPRASSLSVHPPFVYVCNLDDGLNYGRGCSRKFIFHFWTKMES